MYFGEYPIRGEETPQFSNHELNQLRRSFASEIVEIPGGISPAEDSRQPISMRFVHQSDSQQDVLRCGDNEMVFNELRQTLVNILIFTRELGPQTPEELLFWGFLPDGSIHRDPDARARQMNALLKQTVQWVNDSLEIDFIEAITEETGRISSLRITPNISIFDKSQVNTLTSKLQLDKIDIDLVAEQPVELGSPEPDMDEALMDAAKLAISEADSAKTNPSTVEAKDMNTLGDLERVVNEGTVDISQQALSVLLAAVGAAQNAGQMYLAESDEKAAREGIRAIENAGLISLAAKLEVSLAVSVLD